MFKENLQVELNLTIVGKKISVSGGQIRNFSVELHNYGFTADVEFWISQETSADTLFALFKRHNLIEAQLSLQGYYNLPSITPDPIFLQGLVSQKSVREMLTKVEQDESIFGRLYKIHILDTARLLWQQHFPLSLFTDTSMEKVIKAQIVTGINLKMAWKLLDKKHAVICLGLGAPKNEAGFYDFLMWYIQTFNGVWDYDSKSNTYNITDTKPDTGLPVFIDALEVAQLAVHTPETIRHDVDILNSYTEACCQENLTQQQAVMGIKHQVLMRTSVETQVVERKFREAARLKDRLPEILVTFQKFPTVSLRPGLTVRFEKGSWSTRIYAKGKSYRVYTIQIEGRNLNQDIFEEYHQDFSAYQIKMNAKLEHSDEIHVRFPEFIKPHYPLYVEGKIVSTLGQDTDKTYQIYPDPQTSLDNYQVMVPLWNQKVVAPFDPNLVPGHLYLPLFKNTRVLIALDFQKAEIRRCLDWGTDVRLPADSQGNQILFGKNKSSQTSLGHVYEDGKPVLNLVRTSGNDIQSIECKEGITIMEVKEDKSSGAQAEEKYDVTPRVAAAKAELSMKTGSAVAGLTGEFEGIKGAVTGDMGAAIGEIKNDLEAMDDEISDKIDTAKSEISSALSNMAAGADVLKNTVGSAKTELQARLKL